MKDKVSIIIPVYNVEKYLDKCLESVLKQTYDNIEVICINDGSTDDSLNILKKYSKINNKITILTRENKGLLFTRVNGVKVAKGEYIIFLDSDDWLDEDYVSILYNNIKEFDTDIVRCNMRIVKDEQTVICDKKDFDENVLGKNEVYHHLCRNYKFNNAVRQIFKRESIINNLDKIETSISLGEDLEFNLNLYENINRVKTIDYYGYNYRHNPDSITKNIKLDRLKKNIYDTINVYYNLAKFIKKYNECEYQLALSRMLMQLTNHLIRLSFTDELRYNEYYKLVQNYTKLEKYNILVSDLNITNINAIKSKKSILNKMIYKRKIKFFSVFIWFLYKPLYRLIKGK